MAASDVIEGWPSASREAAELVIDAHGEPDEASPGQLVWRNRGPWKRIVATEVYYDHEFPVAHTDSVESFIDYRVPPDKVGELAAFDGSVVVERTAGELSARCRVRSGGAIVNFSTTVTRTSFPEYGAYVASKSAVEGLTLVLARELRGKDITVNAVAPGPTATPLFLDGKPDEVVAGLAKAAPLERLGTPADVAEQVAFLAGPGRWVNGQILFVNGGLA